MLVPSPLQWEALQHLNPAHFLEQAKKNYSWQAQHNEVYKEWIQTWNISSSSPNSIAQIPFLPISFFKTHEVLVGNKPDTYFESSGTTQDIKSKHWVSDLDWYEKSFNSCFESFYGSPKDWCIIGLLPSYLERSHSSLVYMVEKLIQQSGHAQSGFYLYDFDALNKVLQAVEQQGQKVWLIGVSFALTDFAAAFPQHLQHTTIIETGGMKGRKQELTRHELHTILTEQLGVSTIHSEYGMTELLSQAYAVKEGVFKCPPWMKVLVSDEEDPLDVKFKGRGILHIIDLANINSCSFIATEDIGEVFEDGTFTVLGRIDSSARRGCSLLVV
jgi:hypothetical protein